VEQRAEVDERLSETDSPATIEHEVGGVSVFVRRGPCIKRPLGEWNLLRSVFGADYINPG